MSIYCLSCMTLLTRESELCPHCGKEVHPVNDPYQLPVGTRLHGRYLIGRCIGAGGFGITYIGRDLTLDIPVAVKEYYPAGLVNRFSTDSLQVTANLSNHKAPLLVSKGLTRFLDEAHTLAKFASEPNVVCVRDLFEDNGTAYIVMEYLQGNSFKQLVDTSGPMSFSEAVKLLLPVMTALEKIHRQGLIHRDISPSNLILLSDGTVKLLDFGTARGFDLEEEKSMSVILTPGYAPEEQYRSHGEQGPWTDVYGLCATMYRLITGRTPVNAMNRLYQDTLEWPSALGVHINPGQETALMKGLSIHPRDRYPTMAELQNALLEAETPADLSDEERTIRGPEEAADSPEAPSHSAEESGSRPGPRSQSIPARPPVGGQQRKEQSRNAYPPQDVPPETGKKSKKKRKGWLKFAFLGVLAIAVVGVIAVSMLTHSSYTSDYNDAISDLSDVTVTKEMIQSIDRDPDITYLNLRNCEISDEVVAEMGKFQRVKDISVSSCTGFTTLAPLADIPTLTNLDYEGDLFADVYPDLDGSALFNTTFSNVTDLTIRYVNLNDKGSFLKNFPALESLFLSGCSSETDLTALEGRESLRYLYFSKVTVKDGDFTPLGSCSNLRSVDFSGVSMQDTLWMQNLTQLHEVSLTDNGLSSLAGLENHKELSSLVVSSNQLTELASLTGCDQLGLLYANDNQITSLTGLESCSGLSQLELRNNQISDLTPLTACTSLTRLHIDDNPIPDISPLASCTELTSLSMNRLQLTNLDACEAMINLETLSAEYNQLTNINGLINTTQLTDVRLTGNLLTDITPLSKNTGKLECVLLADNQLSDISTLAGNPMLGMVSLDNNQLVNLNALSDAKGLQYLSAGGNQLTDISGITNCAGLVYIDLGDNQLTDISPLYTCTCERQGLMLQNNQITDLSPLPGSVDYVLLSVYGNPITDFSKVEELTNINRTWDELYLSWNDGADFDAAARSSYEKLHYVDVPLDQQVPLKVRNEEVKTENDQPFPPDPEFLDFSGAEADMAEVRQQSRANQGSVNDAIQLNQFLSSLD